MLMTVDPHSRRTVLHLSGTLTGPDGALLALSLAAVTEDRPGDMVVDLSAVESLDDGGVRLLGQLQDILAQRRGRLLLRGLAGQPEATLRFLGLLERFEREAPSPERVDSGAASGL